MNVLPEFERFSTVCQFIPPLVVLSTLNGAPEANPVFSFKKYKELIDPLLPVVYEIQFKPPSLVL
jgi:hypothetical protein